MRCYVDENLLNVIKHNGIYPQDVQIRKNQFLCFGKCGLTAHRLTNKGETIKHINFWQSMTAGEINARFNEMEWEQNENYI